ncbi:MAG TPA: TIGR00730 family Rossman fold protein [Chryseosolibacter sp.]|nr:TIGR00730 family Rossman fold protein [Chryseosolibacter sp.]
MNICVFCGSATGATSIYRQAATDLGKALAEHSFTLIYGGGNVGLMGIVADAVMKHGGKVIGVIPDFLLKREVGHRGITELIIVDSMHERKKKMADLANGFIALPGGWGTLEELAEVLTWRQLRLIHNPVAILNVNSFYDALLAQMKHMTQEGFLQPGLLDVVRVETTVEKLISGFVDRSANASL